MIRQRIVECFEHAEQPSLTADERRNLLHFAIVGGGPTGVEFAAELSGIISSGSLFYFSSLSPLLVLVMCIWLSRFHS